MTPGVLAGEGALSPARLQPIFVWMKRSWLSGSALTGVVQNGFCHFLYISALLLLTVSILLVFFMERPCEKPFKGKKSEPDLTKAAHYA